MRTNDSSPMRNRKIVTIKKSYPTIRCVCNSEILVVPDLKAMNNAVTKHIAEPKQADDD